MIDVAAGTIVVFSDIGCPWAHLAVHRLHARRSALDLDDAVRLDHRCFPLELFNARPTPKPILDAEVPVAGGLDPAAGWSTWTGAPAAYPVTMLTALEAVQAAKRQSLRASEELDIALRQAFFRDCRCISLRTEILDVAAACPSVDVATLTADLDSGRCRADVIDQWHAAEAAEVKGSPHLFLADGSNAHNPGIRLHWEGPKPGGFPVVESDDPGVVDDLLRRA